MIWAAAGLLAMAALAPVAVLVDQPVTVTIAVPEQVRHANTVLLHMEGVVMRRNAPAHWDVFWNGSDEAHLVGYVSVPANAALRDPKPANFTLQ